MNKKYVVLSVVAALVACMSSSVSAGIYEFKDEIESWTVFNVDAMLITPSTPFTYTHNLSDNVDFIRGDQILEASLELDFTNDWGDDVQTNWRGKIWWDEREFVTVGFDGDDWVEVGEVGNDGDYEIVLDVDWIDDNGMLDVTVTVNPNYALPGATAWLDRSTVMGKAEVVPVPGAVLLGMLGLSAAGLRLRKRA